MVKYMSINSNLTDMMQDTTDFEILDHLAVDDVDDLVRRNLVLFLLPNKCEENLIADQMTEYLTNAQLEIKPIYNVKDLLSVTNKNISRVLFVFSFMSSMPISWKAGKSPIEMYMIFKSLEDFGVNTYPSIKLDYIFESIVYFKMLQDHYPQFSMPQTQSVFYPVWNKTLYEEYERKIMEQLETIKKYGHKVGIIRKSFSGTKRCKRFVKLDENDEIKRKLIKSMDFVEVNGKVNNIEKYYNNGFKVAIIKPYCKPKSGALHSVWFINGKLNESFYSNNKKIVNYYSNPFLDEIKKFANDVFKTFVHDICDDDLPGIVRLDIAFFMAKSMQDKHSAVIDGKKMRLYIHNISINANYLTTCTNIEDDEIKEFIDENQNEICRVLLMSMYKKCPSGKILDIIKKLQ